MKKYNYYLVQFKKLFIIFFICSILGTFYEQILNFIINKSWISRQTILYGPFNPVYGFGVTLLIIILEKKTNKNFFILWLYSSLIGGLFEYLSGIIIHKAFGIRFWDYRDYFLNISGYTTIPYIIGWGFFGTLFMKFIYPKINNGLEKIALKTNNIIITIFLLFISIDIILTSLAFNRK